MLRTIALFLGIGIVAALWIVNCSGPKPTVAEVRLAPPVAEDAPYRIEALIRNDGFGHGQAQAQVRLRDRVTGQVVVKEEGIELQEHETVLLVSEIAAPAGDYTPEVEVSYPPR